MCAPPTDLKSNLTSSSTELKPKNHSSSSFKRLIGGSKSHQKPPDVATLPQSSSCALAKTKNEQSLSTMVKKFMEKKPKGANRGGLIVAADFLVEDLKKNGMKGSNFESLPSLHDKVLAAAAEAAISFSLDHKKKRLPPPGECDLYYVNRDTFFSYHKDSELFLQVLLMNQGTTFQIFFASSRTNTLEEFSSASPTSSAKLNAAARAPRSGSGFVPKLSPVIQRATAGSDWELFHCTSKNPATVGANNQKR